MSMCKIIFSYLKLSVQCKSVKIEIVDDYTVVLSSTNKLSVEKISTF